MSYKNCIVSGDQILNTNWSLLLGVTLQYSDQSLKRTTKCTTNLWKSTGKCTLTSKMILHGRRQASSGSNWERKVRAVYNTLWAFICLKQKAKSEKSNSLGFWAKLPKAAPKRAKIYTSSSQTSLSYKNKQPDPLLLLTIDVYDPTPPADNPQEPEKLVDHELKNPSTGPLQRGDCSVDKADHLSYQLARMCFLWHQ